MESTGTIESRRHKTLEGLPLELHLRILAEECLLTEDRKNFRLVCRACSSGPMFFLVWRTIFLSRLAVDRAAFENIIAYPHLAHEVREIVWLELDLESWTRSDGQDPAADDDTLSWPPIKYDKLDGAARDPRLFWLPKFERDNMSQATASIVQSFRTRFISALRDLPNLSKLTTSPMTPGDYVYYQERVLDPTWHCPRTIRKDGSVSNLCFTLFCLPAMNNPDSNITELAWADDGDYSRSNPFFQTTIKYPNAFEALTSIHLCFGRAASWPIEEGLKDFAGALAAAKRLRHLALCFTRCLRSTNKLGIDTPAEHEFSPRHVVECLLDNGEHPCHWPDLVSFCLHNVDLADRQRETRVLKFLEKHANTLRHLQFYHCELPWAAVFNLRDTQRFSIDKICIVDWPIHGWPPGKENHFVVSEADLVNFINGTDREPHAFRGGLYVWLQGSLSVVRADVRWLQGSLSVVNTDLPTDLPTDFPTTSESSDHEICSFHEPWPLLSGDEPKIRWPRSMKD